MKSYPYFIFSVILLVSGFIKGDQGSNLILANNITQNNDNKLIWHMEDLQSELLTALDEFEVVRTDYENALAHKDSLSHTFSLYTPYYLAFASHEDEDKELQRLREQFQASIIRVVKASRDYEDFTEVLISLVKQENGIPGYFSEIASTINERWQEIKENATQNKASNLSIEMRAAQEGNMLGAGALIFSSTAVGLSKSLASKLVPTMGASGFVALVGAGAVAVAGLQYLLTAQKYKTTKSISAGDIFKIEKALKAVSKSEQLLFYQKDLSAAVAKELALRLGTEKNERVTN